MHWCGSVSPVELSPVIISSLKEQTSTPLPLMGLSLQSALKSCPGGMRHRGRIDCRECGGAAEMGFSAPAGSECYPVQWGEGGVCRPAGCSRALLTFCPGLRRPAQLPAAPPTFSGPHAPLGDPKTSFMAPNPSCPPLGLVTALHIASQERCPY